MTPHSILYVEGSGSPLPQEPALGLAEGKTRGGEGTISGIEFSDAVRLSDRRHSPLSTGRDRITVDAIDHGAKTIRTLRGEMIAQA